MRRVRCAVKAHPTGAVLEDGGMDAMLTHLRLMARYNTWQNRSLVTAADGLTSSAGWMDRGAFFGSIAATFNHLLWDDALWLARFGGNTRPE